MISPPQYALALQETAWQGEAVCGVIAETRALAEEAAELVEIVWEELPAVVDLHEALNKEKELVHSSLQSNLAMEMPIEEGNIEQAFSEADITVGCSINFSIETIPKTSKALAKASSDSKASASAVSCLHLTVSRSSKSIAMDLL